MMPTVVAGCRRQAGILRLMKLELSAQGFRVITAVTANRA
jgi:hypothetical protein